MSQNQTPNLARPDLIGIVEIVCGLKLRDWLRNSLVVQFVANDEFASSTGNFSN